MEAEQLVEEVRLWNTPIFGAYLLWRFTQGYCLEHPNGDAPIVLLHFVASAMLTNQKLLNSISNRRQDLQSFVRGFEDTKNSDVLLNIHERVIEKREFTLAAIDLAVCKDLLVWDMDSGKLFPQENPKPKSNKKILMVKFEKEGEKAEILGKWFSKLELPTIASYLKVVF